MTMLEIQILAGLEDDKLLEHIDTIKKFPTISSVEKRTLQMCFDRLDIITAPDGRLYRK